MDAIFSSYSVAMVTPFTNKGKIDEAAVKQLLNYYKEQGVKALLVSGSTGEQHSMSVEERCHLYHLVTKSAPEIQMYAGVAACTTDDAVHLAQAAEKAGAHALMLGFPPYVLPTQENVYDYVVEVAGASSLPIMLYNNPRRTGFNLETKTLYRMLDTIPNVVALKEAGDATRIPEIKRTYPHLQVFSGSDLQFPASYQLQFDGLTSIIGNILPKQMQKLVHLLKEGAQEEAVSLLETFRPLYEAVTAVPAPVGIKYALQLQGVSAGVAKKPLGSIPEQIKVEIDNQWQQLQETTK